MSEVVGKHKVTPKLKYMTLENLIETFINSARPDWNRISCWGANGGPSFKDKFSFWDAWNGDSNVLKHSQVSEIASYKADLSISMGWGLNIYETDDDGRVDRPWAICFPDPSPGHSKYMDFYYNNALVFREAYVVVDGGRCSLPFPNYRQDGTTYCSRRLCDFMRVFNRITGTDNFDYYFNQTGIEIVDEEWVY